MNNVFTGFVLKSILYIQHGLISRNFVYFVKRGSTVIFSYFLILYPQYFQFRLSVEEIAQFINKRVNIYAYVIKFLHTEDDKKE